MGFSESREFINATFQNALDFSREAYRSGWTDDVYRLYRATLDREPDAAGLENWTYWLAGGRPITDAAALFVASPEFQRTYGSLSNAEFVTLLYNNVLDRAPDEGGFANWTNVLEAGLSRAEVVAGFSQSAEFVAATRSAVSDWVRGQGLDEVLEGGGGHNVLFGGLWSDSFVFNPSLEGVHEVIGLEVWDQLVFQDFGYAAPEDVRAHLQQEGADLVFYDQGVEVRFLQTEAAVLDNDDLFGW